RRDVVQNLPVDVAVPDLVITPCNQRLARIRETFLDLLEPVVVGVVTMYRRANAVGQLPFGGGDEVTRQENGGERGMQMRIDETRHQDVIAERGVDAVRMSIQPRLQRLERSNFDDLTVANCDRGGDRQGSIHG